MPILGMIHIAIALLFAVHIVYVSKFSGTNDVLVLTVMQFFIGGACGVACGACFETLSPAWALTPEFFWNMAYLVIFASCVALVIQNVALAHVPPAQASLFLRLESVFGVLFSVLLGMTLGCNVEHSIDLRTCNKVFIVLWS